MLSKKIFFVLIIFYCCPVFAIIPIEDTCFNTTKNLFPRYFAGNAQPHEFDLFYTCVSKFLAFIVDHTQTESPNQYTQRELSRFFQYVVENITKPNADKMSYALLNLKKGLLGGHDYTLTLTEIGNFKRILYFLKEALKNLHPDIPILIKLFNNQKIPRNQLLEVTRKLKKVLQNLGFELSQIDFAVHLTPLEQLPKNIQLFGASKRTTMPYWKPAMLLLSHIKGMVLYSPKHMVKGRDWIFLANTSGKAMSLWLYYKRFLQNKDVLSVKVIPHFQYVLSDALQLIRTTKQHLPVKKVYLKDIDTLGKRLWFFPSASKPIFRLGVRSIFCFLLQPLVTQKTCKYTLIPRETDLIISFSDLAFAVNDQKDLTEYDTQKLGDLFTIQHLDVLRKHLNLWIRAENHLKTQSTLPTIFGSPQQWMNRKIGFTKNKQLKFMRNKQYSTPLLSHLNWKSHVVNFIVSAYTYRAGSKVTPELWNTMIREWMAFNIYFTKDIDIPWRQFQKLGFQTFKHGDFLTSHSNGDNILQKKEILELFVLFTSSLNMVNSSLLFLNPCRTVMTEHFTTSCVLDKLYALPSTVFDSFPLLHKSLAQSVTYRDKYFFTVQNAYRNKKILSFNDVFELFLFLHYQENTIEFLDKDSSQYLNTQELEPYIDIFHDFLQNSIPLLSNKSKSFAFITYLFYYGKLPIFGTPEKISDPIHFYNWLLQPEKWKLNVQRHNIFHTLYLMNTNFKK